MMSLFCMLQNNYIKTSKYRLLTFLPLNLFEQFQRLANFYFLCLMLLQMISVISSLTPITTSIPLIGVLSLTAIKDAYDDYVSTLLFLFVQSHYFYLLAMIRMTQFSPTLIIDVCSDAHKKANVDI